MNILDSRQLCYQVFHIALDSFYFNEILDLQYLSYQSLGFISFLTYLHSTINAINPSTLLGLYVIVISSFTILLIHIILVYLYCRLSMTMNQGVSVL